MPQNTGDHFKKYMAFSEGNKLFAGGFRANLDETNTDVWFNLQRAGTVNGLYNINGTFARKILQLKMSVLHQSMCIFKSGLSIS